MMMASSEILAKTSSETFYAAASFGLQKCGQEYFAYNWPEPAFISLCSKWNGTNTNLVISNCHDQINIDSCYYNIVSDQPLWIQSIGENNISNKVQGLKLSSLPQCFCDLFPNE